MTQARVHTTGRWSVLIGQEFEFIDNGDSWQARNDSRIVYVSALTVKGKDGLIPARALRETAIRQLGSAKRFSHDGDKVQGDAEIHREGEHWQLKGTMCSDGSIATCVIDFPDKYDEQWAVSIWQSLSTE